MTEIIIVTDYISLNTLHDIKNSKRYKTEHNHINNE